MNINLNVKPFMSIEEFQEWYGCKNRNSVTEMIRLGKLYIQRIGDKDFIDLLRYMNESELNFEKFHDVGRMEKNYIK